MTAPNCGEQQVNAALDYMVEVYRETALSAGDNLAYLAIAAQLVGYDDADRLAIVLAYAVRRLAQAPITEGAAT